MTTPTHQSVGVHTGFTLSQLLDPPSWEIPEWDGHGPYQIGDQNEIPTVEKINRLDSSIALLRRYRNSLLPIQRLPSDILRRFFEEVAASDDGSDDPQSSLFGSYPWIYVTHVCHRWREAALGCPAMWADISTSHQNAAIACLARSSNAGLSVVLNLDASNEIIEAIAAQVHRIRYIYMPADIFTDDGVSQPFLPIFKPSAPMLEKLQVSKAWIPNSCYLLPTMFAGETPLLSKMVLRYIVPQLNRVSYANLRELMVKGKKREVITASISQLLDLLEACPRLEIFMAVKARILADEKDAEMAVPLNGRKVHMEHLRLLEIARSSAAVVANILRHLEVPEFCGLRLNTWLEMDDEFSLRFGIPANLGDMHHLRDIKKLRVNFMSALDSVMITAATSKSHPWEVCGLIDARAGDELGDMFTIAGALMSAISKTLALQAVEEFTISESRFHQPYLGFSVKLWAEILQRMPHLKTLHIKLNQSSDDGFSRTLLTALGTSGALMGKLVCPELEYLSVANDLAWSTLRCYSLAEERASAGHPLKRVSMVLPHYKDLDDLDITDVPLLKKVVETVDFQFEETDFPDFAVLS